jgi:hypothetical protein
MLHKVACKVSYPLYLFSAHAECPRHLPFSSFISHDLATSSCTNLVRVTFPRPASCFLNCHLIRHASHCILSARKSSSFISPPKMSRHHLNSRRRMALAPPSLLAFPDPRRLPCPLFPLLRSPHAKQINDIITSPHPTRPPHVIGTSRSSPQHGGLDCLLLMVQQWLP